MAQFVVRNLEADVKTRLKQRALRHGRSMEDEVRHILRNAATAAPRAATGLGARIVARFQKIGLEEPLPELRGRVPRPADFGR